MTSGGVDVDSKMLVYNWCWVHAQQSSGAPRAAAPPPMLPSAAVHPCSTLRYSSFHPPIRYTNQQNKQKEIIFWIYTRNESFKSFSQSFHSLISVFSSIMQSPPVSYFCPVLTSVLFSGGLSSRSRENLKYKIEAVWRVGLGGCGMDPVRP